MTDTEILKKFDILYNNITSNRAPGLVKEEKEFFLDKALDELIKNYFIATNNHTLIGFDESPKRQEDFSTLIIEGNYLFEISPNNNTHIIEEGDLYYSSPSIEIKFPDYFILEDISIHKNSGTIFCQVVPISFSEYKRLTSKPYKEPIKGQVWRLPVSKTASGTLFFQLIFRSADIVDTNTTANNYTTRYNYHYYGIKVPEHYKDTFNRLILPESMHLELLLRAIELAKIAWSDNLTDTLAAGNRSE